MSHGEECILITTYHVTKDFETQPRCPACYDSIYEGPDSNDCPTCFGTTFADGVKGAYRAWGLFTDAVDQEDHTKHGLWHPIGRQLQTEPFPDIMEHDFVVRVTSWSVDHVVEGVEGVYLFDVVTNESLRTGNRAGQIVLDAVGQRASLERASEQMPIHRFPVVGRRFDRIDGRER